jgi:hypothetical protein
MVLRTSRTARLKCAGAPSCMCHIRALTASGTSSSSFGRSCQRKSRWWFSVSRCGKTCGPTEQSPTIPAHILMLNCRWWLHSILSAITQIKCFWSHFVMDIFFWFWYVELVPKVCPHISVTLCIGLVKEIKAVLWSFPTESAHGRSCKPRHGNMGGSLEL